MTNEAQNIVALLTRNKAVDFTLDNGVTLQIRSLSLGALEDLQKSVEELSKSGNPIEQFQPVLRTAVVGLENVTLEEMRGFLLEDLKKIADKVMLVGK